MDVAIAEMDVGTQLFARRELLVDAPVIQYVILDSCDKIGVVSKVLADAVEISWECSAVGALEGSLPQKVKKINIFK